MTINFKFPDFRTIALFLLSILIIVLALKNCQNSKDISFYEKEKKVDSTTIKTWKDKFNKEHSKVKVNEINYANLMNAKDGEIAKLREEIKLDKTIKSKTIISNTTKIPVKTVFKDSLIYITNIEKDTVEIEKTKKIEYKDEWVAINGVVKQNDSVDIDIDVKNKYDLIQRYNKGNLFKRDTKTIEIINQNPYTKTDKIQTFELQNLPKKFYQTKTFYLLTGAIIGIVGYHQISK